MDKKFVPVGEIVKPHGLRGELCIESHAESPEVFGTLPRVYLLGAQSPNGKPKGKPKAFEITAYRFHKKRVLLKVKGIEGRDQVEAWRGATVHALLSDLPQPEEDDIFLFELEGLEIRLEDGSVLGHISSVVDDPQEVWTIRTPEGVEVLFPAQEEFLVEADPDEGYVVIAPPPGLLELYLGEEEA